MYAVFTPLTTVWLYGARRFMNQTPGPPGPPGFSANCFVVILEVKLVTTGPL
jgi:hypothetical protein